MKSGSFSTQGLIAVVDAEGRATGSVIMGDRKRDLRLSHHMLIVARIHEASCCLRVQLLDVPQAPDIVEATNVLLRRGQRGIRAVWSVRLVNFGRYILATVI